MAQAVEISPPIEWWDLTDLLEYLTLPPFRYTVDAGLREIERHISTGDLPLTVERYFDGKLQSYEINPFTFHTKYTLAFDYIRQRVLIVRLGPRGERPWVHVSGDIPRARRVLFIDGEMSALLFKDRIADVVRRLGCLPPEARFLSHEDVKDWQPLNTEAGQRYIHEMVTQTGAEAVFFDNVMALILGDMRDEEAWRDTMPLIMQLTARRIGQLWFHHTGHDPARSYGTKTREWKMDTVIHGTEVKRADTDVSFQLEFRKARGRRPETRHEFQPVDIALVNDKWIGSSQAKKVRRGPIPPVTEKFFKALENVFAGGHTTTFQSWKAVTMDQWRAELRLQGLVDKEKPPAERSLISRHRTALIAANYIACNNDLVWIV